MASPWLRNIDVELAFTRAVQGQSAKNGILAVSDLESHHRARGSCPWVFWDPLLHIKLGCRANP